MRIVLASEEERGDAALLQGLIDTHNVDVLQITPSRFKWWSVADVWGELLGYDQLTADVGFYELGGDSIIALKIVNRLSELAGVRIQAADLLSHADLPSFTALIERRVKESSAVTAQETTAQHDGQGADIGTSEHVANVNHDRPAMNGGREGQAPAGTLDREMGVSADEQSVDGGHRGQAIVGNHDGKMADGAGDKRAAGDLNGVLGVDSEQDGLLTGQAAAGAHDSQAATSVNEGSGASSFYLVPVICRRSAARLQGTGGAIRTIRCCAVYELRCRTK